MNPLQITILGAGQMGSGIAQVAAQNGCQVRIYDLAPEASKKALANIEKGLGKLVAKGRLSEEDQAATLKRLEAVEDIKDIAPSDVVIEAIVENLDIKRKLWSQVDAICRPDAIFASNTSSLSITDLAAGVSNPERFIGMHFFNPVPMMQLVEVIDSLMTSKDVHDRIVELAKQMGKTPVVVNDSPGFVVNRLLIPMINEAFFVLAEGVASAEDIDQAMKLGLNHPMGPLALADLIGLDTVLAIMEVLYQNFEDSKYRACPLLRKYVQAKRLGRKTGHGVYNYNA